MSDTAKRSEAQARFDRLLANSALGREVAALRQEVDVLRFEGEELRDKVHRLERRQRTKQAVRRRKAERLDGSKIAERVEELLGDRGVTAVLGGRRSTLNRYRKGGRVKREAAARMIRDAGGTAADLRDLLPASDDDQGGEE